MRRLIIILIISSAIFLIASTFLFGYKQYFSLHSEIDSSRFYEYGQFTSGLIGLVIAGFSVYLIFLTFRNQRDQLNNSINQLDISRNNHDFEVINTTYVQILQDVQDITYIKSKPDGSVIKFQGYDAFYNWDEDTKTDPNSVLNHLVFILNSIENYLRLVKSNLDEDDPMYDIHLSRIYLMFHAKIIWPVMERLYNSQKVKDHTDSQIIFSKMDNLIIETYTYLLGKEMLNKPDHPRIRELLNI